MHDSGRSATAKWSRILLALLAAAAACDVPAPAEPEPVVHLLPEVGLLLINRHGSGLAALDITTGRPRWSVNADSDPDPAYGHYRMNAPRCPPHASEHGWILISYSQSISVISADDGHGLWERRLWTHEACAVVTPGAGGVVVATETTAHGALEKFDSEGGRVWTCPLPDVGRVVGTLSVDPSSGDILGRTFSHAFAVSPTGELNWVREIATLGRGVL